MSMNYVDRAGDRLINKASQLIDDQTTNLSECYMSICSKMDGGKQINRIESGSFQHRCMGAGLHLTLGPSWIAETCMAVTVPISHQHLPTLERESMK